MTLDAKALEAAGLKLGRLIVDDQFRIDMARHVIQAYLDAADLVPSTDGRAIRERMSQEGETAQIQARQDRQERDEARREAEETKTAFTTLMRRVEELLGEAETRGKQIAALREALEICERGDG